MNDIPDHLRDAASRNPSLADALAATKEISRPLAEPESVTQERTDPVKELAAPLDDLPKFEAEHRFTLLRPVKTDKGELKQITLRAPTGMDMFEVSGFATRTLWTPTGMTIEMDTSRFRQYLVRLSGLNDNVFDKIAARDLRAMYEWLNNELAAAGN